MAQPLQVAWYNAAVEPHLRLPDFDRPDSLAVLIGNTRALWPRLLDAMRDDDRLRHAPDPVDRYTMSVVGAAAERIGARREVRWAHTVGAEMVAMQRLAQIAGLAYLSPALLAVHPQFGPWIGLRAVVCIDVPGPAGDPPALAPPCDACDEGCRRALSDVIERSAAAATWRDWLAVRDACPRGREHRYDDDQIEYHYTKNLASLLAAVDRGR